MNVPFILLIIGLLQSSVPDSIPKEFQHSFKNTPIVFHYPNDVIFNTRPYDIDLFVNFDREEISSVSLFLKTDSGTNYTEHQMGVSRARYRYRFDPNRTPANKIEYFFVVILKDFSIYATPLDENGYISPVKRTLEDPAEYFKRKLAKRR